MVRAVAGLVTIRVAATVAVPMVGMASQEVAIRVAAAPVGLVTDAEADLAAATPMDLAEPGITGKPEESGNSQSLAND